MLPAAIGPSTGGGGVDMAVEAIHGRMKSRRKASTRTFNP
jgi:hypothetical protein